MSETAATSSPGGFVLPNGARDFFGYKPQRLFAEVARPA